MIPLTIPEVKRLLAALTTACRAGRSAHVRLSGAQAAGTLDPTRDLRGTLQRTVIVRAFVMPCLNVLWRDEPSVRGRMLRSGLLLVPEVPAVMVAGVCAGAGHRREAADGAGSRSCC